jgi:hypothetical protein
MKLFLYLSAALPQPGWASAVVLTFLIMVRCTWTSQVTQVRRTKLLNCAGCKRAYRFEPGWKVGQRGQGSLL